MRFFLTVFCTLTIIIQGSAQSPELLNQANRKGQLYFYYGWNFSWHTESDIHFEGNDFNFTLKAVKAKDKQSSLDIDTYFKYNKFTTPQYNFRVGYFLNDNYSISFGTDHMKYVMVYDQVVKISGHINNELSNFQGNYSNDDIALTKDFLRFEHTDGLNYINMDVRRFDNVFYLNKVKINITEGLGAGILYPRTNVTLMNYERNDEFHVSGYGFSAVLGLNITFFDCFFVQTELKGGYINMPDIVITNSSADKASQSFFFGQYNFVFGGIIKLNKHRKSAKAEN